MNLATSLLSKNQSLGINFPASGMFSTFNLDDFAKNQFQNFAFSDLNRKNKVFIGDPDMGEPERDKFVESTFKGFVISDDIIKNRLYDVGEVIYGNFYYFISKNGAFLLKKYKDLLSSIGTDEMAVFLEINDGDVFSPAVMHVCAGAKMKKYASSVIPKSEDKTDYVVKNLFDNSYVLTNEQVDNLIASLEKEEDWFKTLLDIIVDTQQALIDGVFYLAINAFDGLAGFFGHTLRIPESFWNPRIKGYSVGLTTDSFTVKLNSYVRLAEKELNEWKGILPEFVLSGFMSLVGILKSYISNMKAFQKALEGSLAAAIGFWNGLMDLISSIFLLIKLVLSAINGLVDGAFAGYEYASNTEYYKALFWEYLDNIFQAFIHLDWQEIIESVSNGCAEINAYIKDIPARIVEKLAQLNHAEIGYYTGYGLFVILEFLLPILKVAKLGKLSKLGDVFGDLGKIEIKGNNLIERFSNLMDLFLFKINEGTDALRKWIDEIFTRFKKWLDELFGKAEKIDAKSFNKFRKKYPTILKKGDRRISKEYYSEIKNIEKDVLSKAFQDLAEAKHIKYLKTSKAKKKLAVGEYVKKLQTLEINKAKGKLGEKLIQKFTKGKKIDSKPFGIRVQKKMRFPDLLNKNTIIEVKSGGIKFDTRTINQIDKDLSIIKQNKKFHNNIIKKSEWHSFGEIDELVLQYIEQKTKDLNLPKDCITIILH